MKFFTFKNMLGDIITCQQLLRHVISFARDTKRMEVLKKIMQESSQSTDTV